MAKFATVAQNWQGVRDRPSRLWARTAVAHNSHAMTNWHFLNCAALCFVPSLIVYHARL
jgi:hypothetical protein